MQHQIICSTKVITVKPRRGNKALVFKIAMSQKRLKTLNSHSAG